MSAQGRSEAAAIWGQGRFRAVARPRVGQRPCTSLLCGTSQLASWAVADEESMRTVSAAMSRQTSFSLGSSPTCGMCARWRALPRAADWARSGLESRAISDCPPPVPSAVRYGERLGAGFWAGLAMAC